MSEVKRKYEKRIDFLDIISLLISKIHWLLLLGILGGIVLWLIATNLITPQYRASATIYVSNDLELISKSSISSADLQASQNLAKTYTEILQSNHVLDNIIEALPAYNLTRGQILQMLRVSRVDETQLLRLSVTSKDADLAYKMANAFAEIGPKASIDIMKVGSAEIVDYAERPRSSVLPNIRRYTISGFLGGVLAAALLIVLRSWTDCVLYDSEDVEKACDLTILGQIPEIELTDEADVRQERKRHKKGKRRPGNPRSSIVRIQNGKRRKSPAAGTSATSKALLFSEKSPFAVKEAYIKLRTNLMFCMPKDKEKNCKVFAITSANSHEGKSISAANIAISFAMLGRKTLLIDADLRKPLQKKLWKIKEKEGISNYLAGLGSLVQHKENALPLTIICAGMIPPNPTELLSSSKMSALIEELRDSYEYIIVDTPPVNVVADAQILAPNVDGVVLVVRSGKTESYELAYAIDVLKRVEGNPCGVLLNMMSVKTYKKVHGSKYGYNYNSYGYYDEY